MIGVPEEKNNMQILQDLKDGILRLGRDEQLLMYLTGSGGTSKSHAIFTRCFFSKEFSANLQVMFEKYAFMIRASTWSAAILLDNMTMYKGVYLNWKRITDELREEWKSVRIIFIDECSFFSIIDLENLYRKLKLLQRDKSYSGVIIVFAGDFYHLIIINGNPIYSWYHNLWHSIVKKIVKLQTSHPFNNDLEFSELLNDIGGTNDQREIARQSIR